MFLSSCCHILLFATPWTAARLAPLSMEFPRKEYWLSFPPPGDFLDPGIEPVSLASPTLAGGFFTTAPPGKPRNPRVCMYTRLLQSRPTPCDPVDCSPPGSSVHGILQARILEWVAMPSSKGSSQHWDQTLSPALAGGVFNTSATWEARNLWPNLRAADRGGSSPRPPTSTLLDFIQRVHQKP